MVYDILEVFKKEYEIRGEDLILGSYRLKDGIYILIKENCELEYYESKSIKNEKIFVSIDGIKNQERENYFKQMDYYSNVVETAKSYDAPIKSIHNNNYLTLFMKVDKFLNVDIKYIRNKLFLTVLNFKNFRDKKDKEIICKYHNAINVFSRKKDIVNKYKIMENKIEEIKQKVKDLDTKNYIKIFFDEDILKYKNESEIYLALKVFNKNKYNQKVEDIIYGLSNSNMGLNSKKPFLENKNRKLSIPFMITNEDALLLKKFFDWLKVQPYNEDRTLDEHFFIHKHLSNDEAEITDFDYIPLKEDDINKSFEPINIKNYLNIKNKDGSLVEDFEIKDLWQLEKKVDELFYNGQLIFNYYRDNSDIKLSGFLSKELQSLLFITKYSMMNYFKKYDGGSFYNSIKKYGTAFICDSFINGREFKGKQALNLKFSILKYKGEKILDTDLILSNIKKRMEEATDNSSLTKEEFLLLAGQWAYYLLSQSKASDRTFSLAEHYFRVSSLDRLKTTLKNDLKKYKHAISRESKKIRRTIALITQFDTDKKRLSDYEKDIFLVGFTIENIFYELNKKEKK